MSGHYNVSRLNTGASGTGSCSARPRLHLRFKKKALKFRAGLNEKPRPAGHALLLGTVAAPAAKPFSDDVHLTPFFP